MSFALRANFEPSLLGRIRSVAGNGDGETVCEGVEEKSAEVTNHCFLEYQPLTTQKLHIKYVRNHVRIL